MKTLLHFRILLIGLSLIISQSATSQVLNDDIYVEYGIGQWVAIVYENNDIMDMNDAEPVIISNLILSNDYDEWYDLCQPMTPGYGGSIVTPADNYSGYEIGPVAFDVSANFYMFGWEKDPGENSNDCVYESAVDDFYASGFANNVTSNDVVTSGRLPGVWHDSFVSAGENVVSVSTTQGIGTYGVDPILYWTYAHGNTIDDPLDFGVMSLNDQKSHVNTTNSAPIGTIGSHDQYTNNGGTNTSNDVYYQFEITTDCTVSISTEGSDFDTVLVLYNENNQMIAENDDEDAPDILTSHISTTLCAGTYKVMVEGYTIYNGNINLNIINSDIADLNVVPFPLPASCSNSQDGEADVAVFGGALPWSFAWDNGSTESELLNVNPGEYGVTVTDACGNQETVNVVVINTDEQAPTCNPDNSFGITVTDVEFVITAEMQIAAMNFDDNCGVEYLEFNAVDIEYDELEFNDDHTAVINFDEFQITATDEAGNSTTCTVSTNILSTPELEPELMVNIYPVPVSDLLNVEIGHQDAGDYQYRVLDSTGRIILQSDGLTLNQGVLQIDLSQLPRGMYIFQLFNKNQSVDRRFTKI